MNGTILAYGGKCLYLKNYLGSSKQNQTARKGERVVKGTFLIFICLLLLISILLFVSPYNLIDYFNAEQNVTSILADPDLREEALGERSEITNIIYLGSNAYQVKTEKNTYIIEIKKDHSANTIQVFESSKHVKQFNK